MTRAEMLELAERVEQASGPERDLDAEIALAITGNTAQLSEGGNMIWCGGWHSVLADLPAVPWSGRWVQVARYTASLDAALTLVPDTHCWALFVGRLATQAAYWRRAEDESAATTWVVAATPSLALCAAALRARAEEARDA